MLRPIVGSERRKGFTLVELAVVIVIIGVLAAFGVPRFLQSVEKSKASEAFNYLSAVQSAQERYIAQNGTYCNSVDNLDISMDPPQYFEENKACSVTAGSGDGTPTWMLKLDRNGNSSYTYDVQWTQKGFDATNSGIKDYPEICPVTIPAS